MRIVEKSDTRLRLADRTLWVSVACVAAAAFLVGRFGIYGGDLRALAPAALLCVFALAFLRSTDVVFDRFTHLCTVRRFDVVRLKRRAFAFGDIRDVAVEIEPMQENLNALPCRLSLVTGGETIPLTASYEPDLKRFEVMREQILDWLFNQGGKPAAAADPVAALVKAGRTIDAIALLRQREGLDLVTAKDRVDKMRGD